MKKYLARKVDQFLVNWKGNESKKPLLVKGARQIGKTEAIRHFANAHYRHFHEINFVIRPEFKQIVEDGYSSAAILRRTFHAAVDRERQVSRHRVGHQAAWREHRTRKSCPHFAVVLLIPCQAASRGRECELQRMVLREQQPMSLFSVTTA